MNKTVVKRINERFSKSVPKNTGSKHIFMIYIDDDYDSDELVKLKIIWEEKSRWSSKLKDISESVACIVYEDSIPYSFKLRRKIMEAIKENLYGTDYIFVNGAVIVIPGVEEEIREIVTDVLDSFRE